jgi:membrane associated rhomboid family serine protease
VAQPFPPSPPPTVRTCYRHPGQPAGVICQRCDKPICPACMHQASVGFHCPECVKSAPQKVYRGTSAFAGNRPLLTQILIGVNVGIFLLGIVMTGANAVDGASKLARYGGLLAQGSFDGRTLDGVAEGQWYRLITSGFLHYGFLHLAFNMYALWVLGGMLEKSVGRVQLAIVYFVSMLGGSLGALIVSPDALTVGASGAIFGLMGAVLALGRSRGISIRNSPVLGVLIINLLLTFGLSSFISVGGHVGGLIAGFITGMLLFELPSRITRTQVAGGSAQPNMEAAARAGMALAAGLAVVLFVGGIVAANAAAII